MSVDQIRAAQPVSAARYGLDKEDAREDGYDDSLELFDRLADSEQRAIAELLGCLDEHLAAAESGVQRS